MTKFFNVAYFCQNHEKVVRVQNKAFKNKAMYYSNYMYKLCLYYSYSNKTKSTAIKLPLLIFHIKCINIFKF